MSKVLQTLVFVWVIGICTLAAAPQASANKVDASLTVLSSDLTIWYYYLSTCPYCRQQEPILHQLQQDYGINIQAISLDGGPPHHRVFGGYTMAGERAAHLSIRATPTLYVFHPGTKQAAPLSVGLAQSMELKRRIVRIAEKTGWLEQALRHRQAELEQAPKDDDANSDQRPANAGSLADKILREAEQ